MTDQTAEEYFRSDAGSVATESREWVFPKEDYGPADSFETALLTLEDRDNLEMTVKEIPHGWMVRAEFNKVE